jgi:hypothetical protein
MQLMGLEAKESVLASREPQGIMSAKTAKKNGQRTRTKIDERKKNPKIQKGFLVVVLTCGNSLAFVWYSKT